MKRTKKWWHKNWYRQGYSHELFDYILKNQTVTKAECRKWLVKEFGVGERAAAATVTTVFSPRKFSRRGDCRGNRSSCGEYYFMEKLERKVRFGLRDPQRFCLRWRERPMEARGKTANIELGQEKSRPARVDRTRAGLLKIKLRKMQQEMKLLEKEMVQLS